MSGDLIIGALLGAKAELVALVPAGRTKAGRLPDDVELPALLVRSISRQERLRLKRAGMVRVAERMEVTVRARTYREQKAILDLVRSACAGKTGTIAGFARVAVTAAGGGPDVNGPASSFEKSQDFRVSYDAPA